MAKTGGAATSSDRVGWTSEYDWLEQSAKVRQRIDDKKGEEGSNRMADDKNGEADKRGEDDGGDVYGMDVRTAEALSLAASNTVPRGRFFGLGPHRAGRGLCEILLRLCSYLLDGCAFILIFAGLLLQLAVSITAFAKGWQCEYGLHIWMFLNFWAFFLALWRAELSNALCSCCRKPTRLIFIALFFASLFYGTTVYSIDLTDKQCPDLVHYSAFAVCTFQLMLLMYGCVSGCVMCAQVVGHRSLLNAISLGKYQAPRIVKKQELQPVPRYRKLDPAASDAATARSSVIRRDEYIAVVSLRLGGLLPLAELVVGYLSVPIWCLTNNKTGTISVSTFDPHLLTLHAVVVKGLKPPARENPIVRACPGNQAIIVLGGVVLAPQDGLRHASSRVNVFSAATRTWQTAPHFPGWAPAEHLDGADSTDIYPMVDHPETMDVEGFYGSHVVVAHSKEPANETLIVFQTQGLHDLLVQNGAEYDRLAMQFSLSDRKWSPHPTLPWSMQARTSALTIHPQFPDTILSFGGRTTDNRDSRRIRRLQLRSLDDELNRLLTPSATEDDAKGARGDGKMKWSKAGFMRQARSNPSLCNIDGGRVVVFGGTNCAIPVSGIELYDIAARSISQLKPLPCYISSDEKSPKPKTPVAASAAPTSLPGPAAPAAAPTALPGPAAPPTALPDPAPTSAAPTSLLGPTPSAGALDTKYAPNKTNAQVPTSLPGPTPSAGALDAKYAPNKTDASVPVTVGALDAKCAPNKTDVPVPVAMDEKLSPVKMDAMDGKPAAAAGIGMDGKPTAMGGMDAKGGGSVTMDGKPTAMGGMDAKGGGSVTIDVGKPAGAMVAEGFFPRFAVSSEAIHYLPFGYFLPLNGLSSEWCSTGNTPSQDDYSAALSSAIISLQ